MSEQNLANICRVQEVGDHENADLLDVVKVNNWRVIAKKGEFKEGDLCVYIQIDSVVPDRPIFNFLEQRKFRVKTIRLRGQISQGIVFPLSIINEEWVDKSKIIGEGLGADLTEALEVKKFEKPIPLGSEAKGSFPTHLCQKTDETRVQNLSEQVLRKFFKSQDIYVTIKHDGSSITATKDPNGEYYLCSRNMRIKEEGESAFARVHEKYNLGDIPDNYTVQAELIGPKIQGNREELPNYQIRVFNVFRGFGDQLTYQEMLEFCRQYSLPMANLFFAGSPIDFFEKMSSMLGQTPHQAYTQTLHDSLLDLADEVKYENGVQAEGLVFRPMNPIHDERMAKNFSFKVVSNKFLEKNKE